MRAIGRTVGGIATLMALLAAPGAAGAQGFGARYGGESAVQFRLGWLFLDGGGDFWDETGSTFTLDESDFDRLTLGFSFVTSINNHLEVGVNGDLYGADEVSQYRVYPDFLFASEIPLFHESRLRTLPLTVDLRVLPFGRRAVRRGGRRASLQPAFYVGAGIGVTFWNYEESGEFIDFFFDADPANPLEPVFLGFFEDSGSAFETHVLAGVEIPVSGQFNLLVEGRYSWADDSLGGDFSGLEGTEIELGGLSTFVGASYRF